jgi:hypothetical protein
MMNLRSRAGAVLFAMSIAFACVWFTWLARGSKKESEPAEKVIPGVTKENVQKIKAGMSEKEVVEILGPWDSESSPLSGYKSQTWNQGGHEVRVHIDAGGKVTEEPIHDFGE